MTMQERIEKLRELGLSEDEINDFMTQDPSEVVNTEMSASALTLWEKVIKETQTVITQFIKLKYKHDATGQWLFLLLIALILGCVITLSILDKITSESSSTLLASIVGYAIGKYQQKLGNNSSE